MSPATQHDKVAHVVAFAVLAVMLATTWQMSAGQLSALQLGGAWLAILFYAGFDEWTQSFVGREASVWDWTADAAGAAVGLALFAWFRRSIRRRLHEGAEAD
jgi:VanZ family protein